MFKICLIDEEKEFSPTVEGFFDEFLGEKNIKYELIYINPTGMEFNNVIKKITEINFDLVLIDYMLITYHGDEIISKLNLENPKLPKVILTNEPESFEEKNIEFRAINKNDIDINDTNGAGKKLIELIIKSIDEYRKYINELTVDIKELHEKILKGECKDRLNCEKKLFSLNKELIKTTGSSDLNYELLDEKLHKELKEVIEIGNNLLKK